MDKNIPDEFFKALLKFHNHLRLARVPPLSKLTQALYSSPPLRHLWSAQKTASNTEKLIVSRNKVTIWAPKAELGIVSLLNTLVNEGHSMPVYEFTMWVDEVERNILNDSEAKALVSALVADILSEISIINESSRQLHNYQPWALTLNCALRENESTLDAAFAQDTQAWNSIVVGCRSTVEKKIACLGKPTGARFYYPVDKRRSKDNVEAMRSAEKNLDEFWRAVDGDMLGRQQKLTALCRLLSQDRAIHRTPEWVEPEKTSKQDPSDSIAVPLSEMCLDLERRTERTIDHASPAAKAARTKTRGTPTETAAPAEPEANANAPVTLPTFNLDARALKVFRTLFYTPSISATPGEVSWVDFLHAMVATGFRPEKLYGSVWQFSPSAQIAERSIQFHEPHPVGKLSYRVTRRIGRRLNRAYGWEGKMFVSK